MVKKVMEKLTKEFEFESEDNLIEAFREWCKGKYEIMDSAEKILDQVFVAANLTSGTLGPFKNLVITAMRKYNQERERMGTPVKLPQEEPAGHSYAVLDFNSKHNRNKLKDMTATEFVDDLERSGMFIITYDLSQVNFNR